LVLSVLLSAPVRADDRCEPNWGCWDLVYSSPGTVLGITGSATLVQGAGDDVTEGAFSTSYLMEHFGTKHGFSAHVVTHGAIGGGGTGTEGQLRGGLDLGLRLGVTDTSGPFLRGGPSGMVLGNHELYFSLLEPLQLRLGYQVLDGDLLVDVGLTGGVLAAGRYDPGPDTARSLARSPELGGYATLQFSGVAFDAAVMRLPAQFNAPGRPVDVGRASLCAYAKPAALCAQVLAIAGHTEVAFLRYRFVRSMHLGLTLGLTP
jgi:hypothetical protein